MADVDFSVGGEAVEHHVSSPETTAGHQSGRCDQLTAVRRPEHLPPASGQTLLGGEPGWTGGGASVLRLDRRLREGGLQAAVTGCYWDCWEQNHQTLKLPGQEEKREETKLLIKAGSSDVSNPLWFHKRITATEQSGCSRRTKQKGDEFWT